MSVLFLSPPSRSINHYRPPLALMYLSGYLKQHGIASKIIDVPLKRQIRNKDFYENLTKYLQAIESQMLEQVLDSSYTIIGITCYTPEYEEVERLARRIKQAKPHVKIIVGGIHPTLYPEDFFESQEGLFDFVVCGEGEVTLLELVRHFQGDGGDFSMISGIGYFDQNNQEMFLTAPRALPGNLDDISYPDYSDLDMPFYTTASPYAVRGVFTRSFYILSSRGCPGSCRFCVAKKLRSFHYEKRVRRRSAKSLLAEIIHLRERYRIDSFYFIDDLFTLDKENVFEFCELLMNTDIPLIWGCSSRVDTLNNEMLRCMRDAGCVQIDFGVEKGSDRALKDLQKGITIPKIRRAFQMCQQLGIRTFANFLVNTPGETEKDLQDILTLLGTLKPTVVSMNIFTPYPGCEIYETHCPAFVKSEYPLLAQSPVDLLEHYPERFRFAAHTIDLGEWTHMIMKRYNKLLPNAKIYSSMRYQQSLLASEAKFDYLLQMGNLLREFINQKR